MANIEECKKWCEKARDILGLGLPGTDSAEMKSRTSNVAKYLKELEKVPELKADYDEALKTFNELSAKAKLIADKKTDKTYKEKHKKADMVAVSDEIGDLEEDIKYTLEEHKKVLSTAEQFKKAKEDYVAALLKANQEVAFLKVIPKSDATGLEKRIDNIINTAGQDTLAGYTQALTLLKAIPGDAKKEKSNAEGKLKKEQEQFGKRPEFLQKLEVAKRTYAELSNLIGVEATLKQYADIIKAAEDFNLAEQWIEGIAKIKELDKVPKASDVQKQSAQKVQSLNGIADYDRGKQLLIDIKKMVPASEVAGDEKDFNAVLDSFLATNDPGKTKQLKPIVQKLEAKYNELNLLRTELQTAANQGINLIEDLARYAPPLEVEPYRSNFETFMGLWTKGDLLLAKEVVDKVLPAIRAIMPGKKAAAETWQKEQGDVVTLQKELEGYRNSECELVKTRAMTTGFPITKMMVDPLVRDRDWSQLVANLKKVREGCAEIKKLEEQYNAFGTERTTGDRLVTSTVAQAKQQWQALAVAAQKAGGPPPESLKPLLAEVERLEKNWKAGLLKAVDTDSLGLSTMLGALAEAQKQIETGTSTDGLKVLQKDDANNKAKPVFEKNWSAFLIAIDELQALDNGSSATFLGQGKPINEGAALDYAKAVTDLDKISKLVTQAKSLAAGARNTTTQEITQLAKAAKDEIERVKKATSNSKSFDAAFKALLAEHAELLELAKSTNLDAMKEAAAGLRALKTRATKFAPTTTGAGISIDKVNVVLNNATKQLDNLSSKLKTNVPKSHSALTKQAAKLKTEVYGLDPEDAMVKIAAFTKTVTEAETNANKVVEVRKQYEEFLKTVEDSYNTFKTRGGMPKYIEALAARLKEAKDMAKDPDKIYEALQKLRAMDLEMTKATSNPQAGLDQEGAILNKQQEDARQKTEWEHGIKVYESKAIKAASEAVSEKGGDKALIKELERIANLARSTAKKKDYGKALQQLALANERAKQIVDDPYGPAIGSRNKLPKDSQRFREALDAFNKALTEFPAEVKKAMPTLPDPVVTKMGSLISTLSARFDPMAFEAPIQRLTQDGIDDKERRAFREAALAKVRAMQAELAKHPHMVALAANPIAPKEISLVYRRLQSTLTTLDANISRSVS